MPSSTEHLLTISLLLLFLVGLFPSLFHYLLSLPATILLYPLSHLLSSAPPSTPVATCTNTNTVAPPPPPPAATMSWSQKQFTLPPRSRGSYLVTDHVVDNLPELRGYKVGLLNLFVQHTSCALSLNENWDDDVRADMSDALDRIAPEAGPKGQDLYRHSAEGPDDMPVGASLSFSFHHHPQDIGYMMEEEADKRHCRLISRVR
ncbi:UPF0047 domain protein [Apiospora rasikravindrae]|uniref:UPF0047 domain protein n=1 Tax=Apiospora rasikravindrae TaxID=990691 RepID=A0ABR1T6B3_9PEZI